MSRDNFRPSSIIKSIQVGNTTTATGTGNQTGNTTINSIDVNKSVILFNGSITGDPLHNTGWCKILNATTVQVGNTHSGSNNSIVYWTVIEYF